MFARLRTRAACAGLVMLAAAACTDQRDVTAPQSPSKIFVIPIPPYTNPFLPSPTDFVQITAGGGHACARRYDERIYCWGLSNYSQAGNTAAGPCVGSLSCVARPTYIFSGSRVDAGEWHTCALDFYGYAYCWGNGQAGEVGASPGLFDDFPNPTAVYGGIQFTDISAGEYSTCGIAGGEIWCWGNSYGTVPTFLASGPYQNVTAGWSYGCALRSVSASGGAVDCWGYNAAGEAGENPALFPSVAPMGQTQIGNAAGGVVTQETTTCVDQNSGTVQCFGNDWYGQLGNGQLGVNTFVPQPVGGGMALHGVSVSQYHACALDPNGHAYCWGRGDTGELGDSTFNSRTSPVAVVGGHTFRAIAAGSGFTCAIGTDNHIWCWGSNVEGALGTWYTRTYTPYPVQAIDPTT